jgi:oligoendopeptidase F
MTAAAPAVRTFPRRFVAADADLTDWSAWEAHLARLEQRAIGSPAELEAWLADWSEFASCIDEAKARAYVAMTCATDDPAREKAYLHFVENLQPRLKPWTHRLQKKFLESPHRGALPARRYEVLQRTVRTEVEMFRPENIPLQVEDDKLRVEYQKISAAQTVVFDGKEQTLQQMALVLLEQDRARRQAGWELVQARRLADADRLDDVFDRMLELRNRIAANAGFANYRDYMYREKLRFDYGPDDVARFRDTIAETVVPLSRKLREDRRRKLGVDRLRPWDLNVDPDNHPPLRPYRTADELVAKCRDIFDHVDATMGGQFRAMSDAGLLDLDSRKGKAPGGYQETFQEARLPFIFMNSVGTHRDLETMLHEAGHAFHAFATREDPLVWYRGAPMEFCEVASMAMELLAAPYLDRFYGPADRKRALYEHLEGVIHFLPHMATIDGFQDWLYTHPGHTREERRREWMSLMERFGNTGDWTGCEDRLARQWQKQLHIYEVPFYYVEYGIAQLGALQVWVNSRRDYRKAVSDYAAGLALGGSRPLPELFATAGIRFDFSAATIAPLMAAVGEELASLAG